jgi:hypothetical protein
MKRKPLRLLPVAAVLLTVSCTDNQYDLNNINTESQFTAKGLVIPLNMAPIKLDAIISIDDNSEIKKDEEGNYIFEKSSTNDFKSDDVNVKKITIKKPADISEKVTVELALNNDIKEKWQNNAPNMTINDIRDNSAIMTLLGISEETNIVSVNISDKKNFNLSATNIDNRVTKFDKLGIDPLDLSIDVKLEGLQAIVNNVHITDLSVDLPCGMTVTNITDRTNDIYDIKTGKLNYGNFDINGQKNIKATITELTYSDMAADNALFDANAHTFIYNKECAVSGKASIKFKDLKGDATFNDINSAVEATYSCDVKFSKDIVVNTFSGGIDYKVEGINIDPVKIGDLPEILQGEGTNIQIANPQLYLIVNNPFFNIKNPIFNNDLTVTAKIKIKSSNDITMQSKEFSLKETDNKIVLSPKKPDSTNFEWTEFSDMKNLLSEGVGENQKRIPEQLNIEVVNPALKAVKVTDFKLGNNYPGITGKWRFFANLSLTEGSKISYTKEWDDWKSKDLDGLTVDSATIKFTMKKKIALDAESIKFTLRGGKGNLEGSTTDVQNFEENEEKEITIKLKGGPIEKISGGKLVVKLKGLGKTINKDQDITISNLRMTVDGYYDKEF